MRVTTLTAKAASFSGNAFGIPIRSRLKAPSEPQDVLCGINVPVGHVSAREAGMHPIRERLLDLWQSTATATRLRGVLRVNHDASHSSIFRFLSEDVERLRPTCIVRAL